MNDSFIKNMEFSVVKPFAELVDRRPGEIVSKTLVQNPSVSLTLFAFDKGEEISTHRSDGDALVFALEGTGEIVVDGKSFRLQAGDSILMPAKKPHSVLAVEPFKMFLAVVFQHKIFREGSEQNESIR